jgi:hypothetical protein
MVVGTKDDIDKIEPTPADFETAISHTGKIYTILNHLLMKITKNIMFINVFNF